MALWVIDDVVEISYPLFVDEIPKNIHVPVRFGIGRKNVMIGDDHNFRVVPDFCISAKLALENADRTRAAYVMRHQHVRFYPNVVSGLNARLAGGARQYFFSQGHIIQSARAVAIVQKSKIAEWQWDFNSESARIL